MKRKTVGTIKSKVSIMMIATSIILIIGVLFAARVVSERNVIKICENYLYDVCISASDTLYESFWGDTEQTDLSVRIEYTLNSVGIEGMKSSEACLVDKNGVYLYSKDRNKIGATLTDNSIIQAVIDRYQAEDVITTANVGECVVDGVEKYVAFVCTVNDWVLFVQADKAEVLQPINEMNRYCTIVGSILLAVIIVIGYIITTLITRPVKPVTNVISAISEFDLSREDKIPRTNDELGVMGEAVVEMKQKLMEIVGSLNGISENLLRSSNELDDIAIEVNQASTDNSATTEELAAGMEETAASTKCVNDNVIDIHKNVVNVSNMIKEGAQMTRSIMEKSEILAKQSETANNTTMKMYDEIKITSTEAIEKASRVTQISELTEFIQDIADETTLLSFNASIEAARAGEQGRGFAVVANQIGKLAEQSSAAAKGITDLVGQINESVQTVMACLRQALNFLENDVTKDYENFLASGVEYKEATAQIQEFMLEAQKEAEEMEIGINSILSSMEDISTTVNESTVGVHDIAGKTTDIVMQTESLNEMTAECKKLVQQLNAITSSFKLKNE